MGDDWSMRRDAAAGGPRVVVVGGGLTGLTAAHALVRAGWQVRVLEAAGTTGGVVQTHRIAGCLVEGGPNMFIPTPAAEALLGELGMAGALLPTALGAVRRYVVRDERLYPLPTSAGEFLHSALLSAGAKWRAIAEPIRPSGRNRPPVGADESIASLVRRRFGDEIARYVVGPMVAGIYAGDPDRLSVRFAFPRIGVMASRRSVILGAFKAMRRARRSATRSHHRSISFSDGMATLPSTLTTLLGDRVEVNARVSALAPLPGGGWRRRDRG